MTTPSITSRFATLLTLLGLAASATAQMPVAYDEHKSGDVTSPGQTITYFFQGSAGDVLKANFHSPWIGYPTNQYKHELEVRHGATTIGTIISGAGTMTATLPANDFYTVHVRARNNQWTGPFEFKLNRVNNPIGADVQPFGWTIKGSIDDHAEFDMYTIHGDQGKSASLHFTGDYTGYPSNTYDHFCEVLDNTGTQIASVLGNGTSAPFTLPYTGDYTIFVRARDYARTGWYSASVECLSWPSCDSRAYSSNYGNGSQGTNGVPTLTTAAAPQLGTTVDVQIGNSLGQPTSALLLVGLDRDWQPLPTYGLTTYLLVSNPTIINPVALPATGTTVSFSLPIPTAPGAFILTGVAISTQSIVVDPAATGGYAFSPGLMMKIGY